MLNNELWRPVVGYETYYVVSNYGRVRSLPRYVNFIHGTVRKLKGKVLKPMTDANGYQYVMLAYNGTQKSKFIHRLVGEAYLDKPDPSCEINHIDGDKRNNAVDNLEWVSHKHNIQHSFDAELHKKYSSEYMRKIGRVGSKISAAKSSIAVLCESDGLAFVSQNAADRYYGYHAGSVCEAIKHKNGAFKNKQFRILSDKEKHDFTLLS